MLEDTLCQLSAGWTATHRVLLAKIVEYDLSEAWKEDGATSMAAWLCYRLNLRFHNACEWVRVAHALEDLPHIAEAYAQGRLSWDQVRPLTELAAPETDAEALERALGSSAAQLERAARGARRLRREDAERMHRMRFLHWWQDGEGCLRLRGRLPAEDGAVVAEALDRIVEAAPRDPDAPHEPMDCRDQMRADALVAVCSASQAAAPKTDRAILLVNVDATALGPEPDGGAGLENGTPLQLDVVRRLACDCNLEPVIVGPDGVVLGVGRRTRSLPPWMDRQLRRRDGCCRFPGCGLPGWLQAHHIKHWADGGRTDLENLILLCSWHHHLVHELGWKVRWGSHRIPIFTRPDGRELATGPPPLRPETKWLLGHAIKTPALLAG